MEQATFKTYLRILGELSESNGTFRVEAKALMRELLDPCTDAMERLEWIDTQPSDQFEKFLKRKVKLVLK